MLWPTNDKKAYKHNSQSIAFYESIIFSSCSLWNGLPDTVINATPSDLFTKKLNAHIFNVSFS